MLMICIQKIQLETSHPVDLLLEQYTEHTKAEFFSY